MGWREIGTNRIVSSVKVSPYASIVTVMLILFNQTVHHY